MALEYMTYSNLIATTRLFGEQECWKVNSLAQLKGYLTLTTTYKWPPNNRLDKEDCIYVSSNNYSVAWI